MPLQAFGVHKIKVASIRKETYGKIRNFSEIQKSACKLFVFSIMLLANQLSWLRNHCSCLKWCLNCILDLRKVFENHQSFWKIPYFSLYLFSDWTTRFSNKIWVPKRPHKSILAKGIQIIPKQRIFVIMFLDFFVLKRCLGSCLWPVQTLLFKRIELT